MAAECCGAETPEVAKVEEPAGKPDTSEAKSKANEYKDKREQEKQAAEKDGTQIPADPPKPGAAPPPQTKEPAQVNKGHVGSQHPDKKAAAPKAGAKPGHKGPLPNNPPPAGPAAANAQASIAAEVAAFFQKAPKDPARLAVNGNVDQIVQSAQELQKNCPPIGEKKEEPKEPGNLGKIAAAFGKSPYDGMNLKYQKQIEFCSRLRDLFSGVSGVLGTVGMVLSILGLVISITGIGAPLGAPIEAIGNIITVICLVLDATSTILSAIVQGLVMASAAAIKNPNPEQRKQLGMLINKEAQNTAGALISVVLNLPIVGKVAEVGLSKIGGLIKNIVGKIGTGVAKAIGPVAERIGLMMERVGAAEEKAIAREGEAAVEKGVSKAADEAVEKDVTKAADSALEKDAAAGAKAADKPSFLQKARDKAKGYIDQTRGSVNSWLEKKGAKVAESKFGKAFDRVAGKAKRFNDFGGEAIERMGNRFDYAIDRASGFLGRGAKKGGAAAADKLEQQMIKDIEARSGGAVAQETEGAATTEARAAAAEEKSEASAADDAASEVTTTPETKSETPPANETKSETPPANETKSETPPANETKSETPPANETKSETPPANEAKSNTDPKPGSDAKDPKPAPEEKAKPQTKAEAKAREKEKKLASLEQKAHSSKEEVERLKDVDKEITEKRKEIDAIEKRHMNEGGMTQQDIDEAWAASQKLDNLLQEKKAKQAAERELKEAEEGIEAIERSKRASERVKGETPGQGSTAWQDAGEYKHEASAWDNAWKLYSGVNNAIDLQKPGVPGEIMEEQEKENEAQEQNEYLSEQAEKGETPQAEEARAQAGAVKVVKLSGMDGKGGTEQRVSTLLASVDPTAAPPPPSVPEDAPPPDGQPQQASDGQPEPAPAPAPPTPSPANAQAAGTPGAVPYWPELLEDYAKDQDKLKDAAAELTKYKEEQLHAYKVAVGIEKEAGEKKSDAAARAPTAADNAQHSKDDKATLDDMAAKNKAAGAKSDEGSAKQQSATGESSKAGAIHTEVPPPPHESWWQRLKNALNLIKKYILHLLAKGMAWIQNGITSLVLKATGVDPKVIKKFTDCAGGNAAVDAAAAEEGGKQTEEGAAKDKKTEADAEKGMSEAQKLQKQTQANVDSADNLLVAVAQAQTLLAQEIANGKQYLDDVNASVAAQKEQQKAQKEKQAAAGPQNANQKQSKADAGDSQPQQDQADPVKIAVVKQGAQIVKQADTANSSKLASWLSEGKSNLQSIPTASKNPQAVAAAVAAFHGDVGEIQAEYQSRVGQRAAKLDQVAGKSGMSTTEVISAAHEVEEAAAESDSDFDQAKLALSTEYEANYQGLSQACVMPAGGPGPAGAAPPQ